MRGRDLRSHPASALPLPPPWQDILTGVGKFADAHTVKYGLPGRVDVGGSVTAQNIIIATGSVPFVPPGIQIDGKTGERGGALCQGGGWRRVPWGLGQQQQGGCRGWSPVERATQGRASWRAASRAMGGELHARFPLQARFLLQAHSPAGRPAPGSVHERPRAQAGVGAQLGGHHWQRLHRPRVLRRLHRAGLRGARSSMHGGWGTGCCDCTVLV